MPKEIHLKCGCVAIVDDDDFERLSRYHWLPSGKRYAYAERNVCSVRINGKRHRIKQLMHREIMGLERGDSRMVDHINGNTWDNRKENLRITNAKGNTHNARPFRTKVKSRYKGVSRCARDSCFRANYNENGKVIVIGRYRTEVEAALAYDFVARQRYAEFAWLNFPDIVLAEPPKPVGRLNATFPERQIAVTHKP